MTEFLSGVVFGSFNPTTQLLVQNPEISERCGMLGDRYAFELAISRLGEKEKLSLDIKRTITR